MCRELYSDFVLRMARKQRMVYINTDIRAYVPPWHEGLYTGVQEIGAKCMWPGGVRLLHVGVRWKPFAGQMLVKGPRKRWKSMGKKLRLKGGQSINCQPQRRNQ